MNLSQPGDVLAGRYRLQHMIGHGGMGVVWRATDEMLRRDVAVKEAIQPPGLSEKDWRVLRQRVLHEAQAAGRLHHPNIASVYDVIRHDGRPWIVMQLVPYPSLQEVLQASGPMSPADAAHMGLCVLAAMRAAFSAGVLHRDIKPANILLGPDGDVILADFGLAAVDSAPHLTLTGTVVGSPAYMSPERARGAQATLASDLWSLGATLYAAVEGRDPFARSSTMAVLTAVVNDEPDPPELSGQLWPVISALLRKDSRLRQRPDDTERRLAWAAGLLADPGVTRPTTTLDASHSASDETARGDSLTHSSPAADMRVDGSGLFASVKHPPDNPDRRSSRWATGAFLVSALASMVLIALILVMVSLAIGYGQAAPGTSPYVGSTPATQAHTGQSSMQPGQPAAVLQPAPTQPASPTDHVQPGPAKKKHQRRKPKK